MKFRIKFAQQIVGLFVLIAGLSLVGVVVAMGASQRWFARNYSYHSLFLTAEGLSTGMSIDYKGFEVGRVEQISLTGSEAVRVDFYVHDTFHERVRPNSLLELITSPIGIGGGLVIHPGRGDGPPLPELALVPSISTKEGQAIVEAEGATITSSGDSISRIIGQVEPVLRNANTLLLSVDRTLTAVNAALEGDESTPLGESIARVNSLLGEVETTLVVARADTQILLERITGIAGNVEATTSELRDPTGLLPRLLDADGSFDTLLNDNNALYNQVEGILESIGATLDEVNNLAVFVNSSQPQIAGLLEEGRETIEVSQDVLLGLRNNPLLRGGIPEQLPQPTTVQSYRDAQF